jgi:hypothetical protein
MRNSMGGSVVCPFGGKIIKNPITLWYLVRLLPDTHNSPLLEPRCPTLRKKREKIALSAIYFKIFEFNCSFVTMKKERQKNRRRR